MIPGPDIKPLIAARIDERLIAAHWDNVLRLAASIRTGVVSASTMLERLGSHVSLISPSLIVPLCA